MGGGGGYDGYENEREDDEEAEDTIQQPAPDGQARKQGGPKAYSRAKGVVFEEETHNIGAESADPSDSGPVDEAGTQSYDNAVRAAKKRSKKQKRRQQEEEAMRAYDERAEEVQRQQMGEQDESYLRNQGYIDDEQNIFMDEKAFEKASYRHTTSVDTKQ